MRTTVAELMASVAVTVRKDDAPAAGQAAISNVAGFGSGHVPLRGVNSEARLP